VEVEDDGRARLRFGDGVLGREAPTSSQVRYRVGTGREGNVGRESIVHLVTSDPGIVRVWNPLPAQGGVELESLEEARLYAPQAFRTQRRAVTERDYEEMAARHRDVQRAVATLRWTGSWNTLFLTVDRKGGRPVDAAFQQELCAFLEAFRLAGHDLEIDPPIFVPLEIRLPICVGPRYRRADVERALLQRFGNGTLPDGVPAFFHPDRYTFGQPVYLSQLVSAAMEVPGVTWVDTARSETRFQRQGHAPADELSKGLIPMGRLEIARMDNDPSFPEHGKLSFLLEGGL
jgi:predicted phage baseplate assembly protein